MWLASVLPSQRRFYITSIQTPELSFGFATESKSEQVIRVYS